MKHLPWLLFLISVLLCLIAVINKFIGHDSWILGFAPQSWWRVSLLVAVWAIASRFVCPWAEAKE
jgi:hypothetical protein